MTANGDMYRLVTVVDTDVDGNEFIESVCTVSALLADNADDAGMVEAVEALLATNTPQTLGIGRGFRWYRTEDSNVY